jgi:hypothetical protein
MTTNGGARLIPAVTLALTLGPVFGLLASSCGSDKKSSTTTSAAATVEISVTVGKDSSPDRVEKVELGSNVKLSIVDPNTDEEYHVHGYELGDGVEMPKGQPEVFEFVADKAGEFEVESHTTETVLVILDVS